MSEQRIVLESVLDSLREVIPGRPELAPDTELLDSGLLDSLGIISVVAMLETSHGVEFPAELHAPETFTDPTALAGALTGVLAAVRANGEERTPS
ncbi:hypothetical protein GCM10010221_55350 [Streptomyces parvus]|uniref:phosphopantetheine-binding protein n=1 Tax=Streptomyces parvus TaxID=66428 RepID=UPI00142EAF6F|nr:phosphopantetheine-binding protein [Streptomyces parvus]GGS49224.1 hypothetical protein GCM10010221_55350 [Streptomyces parvus]